MNIVGVCASAEGKSEDTLCKELQEIINETRMGIFKYKCKSKRQ
jgi:hypothetical protein